LITLNVARSYIDPFVSGNNGALQMIVVNHLSLFLLKALMRSESEVAEMVAERAALDAQEARMAARLADMKLQEAVLNVSRPSPSDRAVKELQSQLYS
jgi:hypothetical protein